MKRLAASSLTIASLISPVKAFAQEVERINLGELQQGKGIDIKTSIQGILRQVITFVFTAAALAVIVMLIWGAWEWITSGGNKDKIAGAQKRIVNALVGLAILALAFFVARVIGSIVGFDLLTQFSIPTLGVPAGQCNGNRNCLP